VINQEGCHLHAIAFEDRPFLDVLSDDSDAFRRNRVHGAAHSDVWCTTNQQPATPVQFTLF
jgi:hypothetical protein